MGYEFDDIVKFEIDILVEQIKSLNEGIKRLDDEISDQGQKLKGHKNLTSIKGIGDKSSAILLSVIGNINDFKSEDKLAA